MTRAEVDRLKTTIDGALHEREELLREISAKEEQLRQRDQAMEDLERQIGEQREILNDSARTEEEHAAAERELETLQERVTELQGQKDNLERELGLTTKEKIKRALLKLGIHLTYAAAIASAVGVIISMLKGTGSAVKKVGAGLANLGKKMAATHPGSIGIRAFLGVKNRRRAAEVRGQQHLDIGRCLSALSFLRRLDNLSLCITGGLSGILDVLGILDWG